MTSLPENVQRHAGVGVSLYQEPHGGKNNAYSNIHGLRDFQASYHAAPFQGDGRVGIFRASIHIVWIMVAIKPDDTICEIDVLF